MNILIISLALIFVTITNCASPPPSSHFGKTCRMCQCYIKYDNRDFALNVGPYKKVDNGYDATEDDCLKLCWDDEKCKAVTYGMVGGKQVFACELYGTGVVQQPLYVPYMNVYVKRRAGCRAPSHVFYRDLALSEGDQTIEERKSKYIKMNKKVSPFNIGK
uniref:Apple domain-containing protein n=1 Tax=Parastrongyloides trichosuri TaxID=131310 RepID=A0A0N4ZHF6_PARTI